jgi:hypothetical protein
VLTTLSAVTCSNTNAGFGQWTVQSGTDTVLVDDVIFAYTPVLGALYTLTGPMYYSFSERKIEPRSAGDVVAGIGEVTTLEATVLPNPASDELLVTWTGGMLKLQPGGCKGPHRYGRHRRRPAVEHRCASTDGRALHAHPAKRRSAAHRAYHGKALTCI